MLKFYFGASGSGKSTRLYQEFINKAQENPDQNFLYIVPDQFTMQTQMDMIRLHPDHGIMNIDVLSFGRLSHRVFEETGSQKLPVLDDVGKSLILRHVAELNKDKLPVIGSFMHRAGYIDEVKSTISEFMQYGLVREDIDMLANAANGHGALRGKLSDLGLLFSEFQKYTENKFVSAEETMGILKDRIDGCRLLAGSVVVFDGFTGFTPIQYQVLEKIIEVASQVIITLDMGEEVDPYQDITDEQELFFLSKKTMESLIKCQWQALMHLDPLQTPDYEHYKEYRLSENGRKDDVFLHYDEEAKTVQRLKDNPPMAFLEENLFRYKHSVYDKDVSQNIIVAQADNIEDEVRNALMHIRRTVMASSDVFYRDFAICCGDLECYNEIIERMAQNFHVPVYIDKTSNIRLNPFIEYIRSAINMVRNDYSYETVFHFMRSGMTDFENDDIDELENYVRSFGIRGHKAWEDIFTKISKSNQKTQKDAEYDVALLEKLNTMRQSVVTIMDPLVNCINQSVLEMTKALYEFIIRSSAEKKLQNYAASFREKGDLIRAKEYEQIYEKIMNLLDQIALLLGDEKIDWKEYMDILDAGFGDIEVGTIPQNVDYVTVGDIERSRLSNIKYLLFLGVNDTNIPKRAGEGGLLSDIDREFLKDNAGDIELAPTPRQQMYIQRLYLYMNLTKPSQQLYLSYSLISSDGKSMRPAYLIGKLKGMFKLLKEKTNTNQDVIKNLLTIEDAGKKVAELIRDYSDGYLTAEEEKEFLTLYDLLKKTSKEDMDKLKKAAFLRYQNTPLPKTLAAALYGNYLENSVSRLETFASCCYEHFVKYGLGLEERKEYEFGVADLGNVFHGVLELFSIKLNEKGMNWKSFTKEEGDEVLAEALEEYTKSYGETILYSTARNQFVIERIRRILSRTIESLSYQLRKGSFYPDKVEMDFSQAGDIDEINIALTDDEKEKIRQKMTLHGRIDRLDLAEDENKNIYVKIIDFKSGNKSFDIASVYYGLSLQLVLYMNVAAAMEENLHKDKEVIPAALLYYHVEDPLVSKDGSDTPETINRKIREELKTTGVINSDDKVIELLDNDLADPSVKESDVIPVKRKKDGSLSAASKTIEKEDYKKVSAYVTKKIKEYGRRILDGDIEINPYEMGQRSACTYCSFHSICRFDPSIDGFGKRSLEKLSKDEALKKMEE